MLMSMGHKVYMYGARSQYGEPPDCTEFIGTHDIKDIAKDFGDGDNREEIGYQWKRTGFRHDWNAPRKPSTLKFYANAIKGINERKKADHFLLLMQGSFHKPIADSVKLYLSCEPGIGYRGSFARFRAFESSYLMHFMFGSEHPFQSINGDYYSRVIGNYFDPADFEYSNQKDDYYLYIGRIIQRKGIATAVKTCNAIGKKLIIAGQGGKVDARGRLIGEDITLDPGTWEYIGYADFEKRKRLMSQATATFVPTEYLEPFAGVHIESMLSGTPAITTNFGVFSDTIPNVLQGIVGWRCNTLKDFVEAAKAAANVDHAAIRKYAERFLMDNVKHEFKRWFDDLHNLWESTVDASKKGWHRL